MPNTTLSAGAAESRLRATLEEALAELDLDWTVLRDFSFGAPPDDVAIDYVAIHPAHGVALIDVAPGPVLDPVGPFRRFLRHERFPQRFPGFLPAVHVVADQAGAQAIGQLLATAFAETEPPTIGDGRWPAALNDL